MFIGNIQFSQLSEKDRSQRNKSKSENLKTNPTPTYQREPDKEDDAHNNSHFQSIATKEIFINNDYNAM